MNKTIEEINILVDAYAKSTDRELIRKIIIYWDTYDLKRGLVILKEKIKSDKNFLYVVSMFKQELKGRK